MKYITQFRQGQWWISADGRVWKRLNGPVARQLVMSFELLQGVVEMIAEPDDGDFVVQVQFSRNTEQQKLPPNMQNAMRKASKTSIPITNEEITDFAYFISKNQIFKKLHPKK
jgi:hypothetical protein